MIQVARYALYPRAALGHFSKGLREGALLRVNHQGQPGYADCFPWPELGDAPLAAQLQALAAGTPTRLLTQSLAFAAEDAQARSEGRSLVAALPALAAHALVTDVLQADVRALQTRGFDTLKVKVGRALVTESAALLALVEALAPMRVRVDFNNACADEHAFLALWRTPVWQALAPKLDWVEDPFPFEPQAWARVRAQTDAPLALDHGGEAHFHIADQLRDAVAVWIVKPAVQATQALVTAAARAPVRIAVTSYLDHPFGQVCAFWRAHTLARQPGVYLVGTGLASQVAYEDTPFSLELAWDRSPVRAPSAGTGFGFNALLDALTWEALDVFP